MPIHEIAALGAAFLWAIATIISPAPASHLGATAFNRLRQWLVFVMVATYVFISGTWQTLHARDVGLIALSGLIGIFIGDTFLFACMNRLGPRRSGILFALNAPIAAILGWLTLGETLSLQAASGVALCFIGVAIAVYFGKRRDGVQVDPLVGTLAVGVSMGVAAALCQAIASLLMRPIMKTGVDPAAATMLRVGVGALALTVLLQLPLPALKQRNPLNRTVLFATAASGFIALGLGMSLILFALSGGHVGIVSTLSATTPVIVLPLLWLQTGVRPAAGAWAGAWVTLVGLALIFTR